MPPKLLVLYVPSLDRRLIDPDTAPYLSRCLTRCPPIELETHPSVDSVAWLRHVIRCGQTNSFVEQWRSERLNVRILTTGKSGSRAAASRSKHFSIASRRCVIATVNPTRLSETPAPTNAATT